MTSPARRHRERVLAAKLAASQATGPSALEGAELTAQELMLAQLHEHRSQLKDLQSTERKVEAKRLMLPTYEAWIDGLLDAETATGKGVQDEVLVTVMIWRMDTGAYDAAYPLAAYVLRHGLALPARFDRTPGCLIAELPADAYLAGTPIAYETLRDYAELTAGEDMPDEARAKLEKAMGRELMRMLDADEKAGMTDGAAGANRARQEAALAHLERARQLNPAAGVKKEIDALKRDLKKSEPAPAGS